MKKSVIFVAVSAFLGIVTSGVYDDNDNASKQMQMLNSQIQSQLQQMQEAQKKREKAEHSQTQAQLKKVQDDIQKQIKDSYDLTQKQLKTMQDTLQAQIKQIKKELDDVAKSAGTKT